MNELLKKRIEYHYKLIDLKLMDILFHINKHNYIDKEHKQCERCENLEKNIYDLLDAIKILEKV